jgi:hydrogenase expression/formation protein HypC
MCLAIPGQVRAIFESGGIRMGKVDFGGVVKDVCLAYLPDLAVGDYTIVHVGFALSRIDEADAIEALRTFRELGLLVDESSESGTVEEGESRVCPTNWHQTGRQP